MILLAGVVFLSHLVGFTVLRFGLIVNDSVPVPLIRLTNVAKFDLIPNTNFKVSSIIFLFFFLSRFQGLCKLAVYLYTFAFYKGRLMYCDTDEKLYIRVK